CVCVSFMRFHSLRLRLFLFFPKSRRPPQSTPFPYTTLFRSHILTRRPVERAAFFETSYGSYDTRNFDLLLTEAKGPLRLSLDGKDRKSTRLNSSHVSTSYAVFCLKKKTVE